MLMFGILWLSIHPRSCGICNIQKSAGRGLRLCSPRLKSRASLKKGNLIGQIGENLAHGRMHQSVILHVQSLR
jgi:hypothetical protein